MGSETAIRELIDSIDQYLASLAGKGIEEVREGIGRWGRGTFKSVTSLDLVVCNHLEPALQELKKDRAPLAEAIGRAAPYLHWKQYDAYPRERIGAKFAGAHGFSTLIGESGFVAADDFSLGLFLIAPHVFYRDHRHAAPELYAPLTGPHGWRFKPGDKITLKQAHKPVWNEPWQPHATKTGNVPFLAIYCWTKDVNEAAEVVASDDWDELERRA